MPSWIIKSFVWQITDTEICEWACQYFVKDLYVYIYIYISVCEYVDMEAVHCGFCCPAGNAVEQKNRDAGVCDETHILDSHTKYTLHMCVQGKQILFLLLFVWPSDIPVQSSLVQISLPLFFTELQTLYKKKPNNDNWTRQADDITHLSPAGVCWGFILYSSVCVCVRSHTQPRAPNNHRHIQLHYNQRLRIFERHHFLSKYWFFFV